MTVATGVAKQLRYKKEVTWGVAPGTGSAQLLRRAGGGSTLSLQKDTYESSEIASHYQRADYRHGVGKVMGKISGELSAGTWKDFFAAALRRAFAAVTAITNASITIAGAGPTYTVTRAAGSFLSDGIKAGDVVRLSVGVFNAANLNKNLLVLSLTATVLTVMPLNGVALVAEGPIITSTVTVIGKKTFAPPTAQTDDSFAFEHWYSDVALSELYVGCKINQMDIKLPPTGMSTIDMDIMGKDVTTAAAQYYITPTAETTFGILASVNGLLIAQGGAIALLTGLDFSIKGSMTVDPVVGSNRYADITEGRILVDGNVTALFQDATIRDYFLNETEVSLAVALSANGGAAADFLAFSMPRIKFGDASKDDGVKALIQTLPFTALYNAAGGAGTSSEQSTLVIQDSQA